MHYLSVRGPAPDLAAFLARLRAEPPRGWTEEEVAPQLLAGIGVKATEHLLVRSPTLSSRSYRLTLVLTPLELALVSVIPVEERYERELSASETQEVLQLWLSGWAAPVLQSMPSLSLY